MKISEHLFSQGFHYHDFYLSRLDYDKNIKEFTCEKCGYSYKKEIWGLTGQ